MMKKTKTKTTKSRENPQERIFIVTESYAGTKPVSEVYADLLYSAYCKSIPKQEPENTGGELNHIGYLPTHADYEQYGNGAY